jgi:hypothetical protein
MAPENRPAHGRLGGAVESFSCPFSNFYSLVCRWTSLAVTKTMSTFSGV